VIACSTANAGSMETEWPHDVHDGRAWVLVQVLGGVRSWHFDQNERRTILLLDHLMAINHHTDRESRD
jgi:hypothetical protein